MPISKTVINIRMTIDCHLVRYNIDLGMLLMCMYIHKRTLSKP